MQKDVVFQLMLDIAGAMTGKLRMRSNMSLLQLKNSHEPLNNFIENEYVSALDKYPIRSALDRWIQ